MVLHDDQQGYGFDLCEALVRRKHDLAHGPERLALGVAEAARIPVQRHAFDKVFCYSVSQCFPSEAYAANVVREMLRVCRPGGIVLWGDVLGELEKLRKRLIAARLPEPITDGLLWTLGPIGRLRHNLRHEHDGMIRRLFRRSFFKKAAGGFDCDIEFLEQAVDGRRFAATRYDVRFRLHGAS
jgi:SAM-dependent methyltransferase